MKKNALLTMLILTTFGIASAGNPLHCLAIDHNIEVISAETGRTIGGTWRSADCFYHSEEMSVKVTAKNNEATTKKATIYVNAFDDLNQPFDHYKENITFSANETKIVYCQVFIPKWALSGGNCRITATAKTLPEGTYCQQKTDDFYLLSGTPSYLTVQTATYSEQAFPVSIWIDADIYRSSVTVPLPPGAHVVKVQAMNSFVLVGKVIFICEYERWEDASTANPRTISITQNANKTIIAYYVNYCVLQQAR